mmetsp:Transcript_30646/g.74821  ORF Transcript_30646/g.74821 Transcript_30646/m.74821 type:complete len:249 (-) Transcript_30646:315-1061(-)
MTAKCLPPPSAASGSKLPSLCNSTVPSTASVRARCVRAGERELVVRLPLGGLSSRFCAIMAVRTRAAASATRWRGAPLRPVVLKKCISGISMSRPAVTAGTALCVAPQSLTMKPSKLAAFNSRSVLSCSHAYVPLMRLYEHMADKQPACAAALNATMYTSCHVRSSTLALTSVRLNSWLFRMRCLTLAITPRDWMPCTSARAMGAARYGSSPVLSKLRPPVGTRAMFTIGPSITMVPFMRCSVAIASP